MDSVSLRVSRFDPETGKSGWAQFDVALHEKTTVLDCLDLIQRTQDPSLGFRYACRVGMCGSCAMVVNGRERWTCRTLVRTLSATEIRLEPLRHLRVIRDLIVDFDPLWKKYRDVRSDFVPSTEAVSPARTQRARPAIEPHIECISCAACYSACGYVGTDPEYLGPHAMNRVFTLVEDLRDGARDLRLQIVDNEHGCWKCHVQQNCTFVCPMTISPSAGIQALKQKVIERRLLTGSRRKFVYLSVGAAVAAMGAYLAVEPPKTWVAVGPVNQISEVQAFQRGRVRLYIRREASGGFVALSRKCTHQGCLTTWNGGARTLDCACHGGRFAPSGEPTAGPPVRPLERYETRVVGDVLEVFV